DHAEVGRHLIKSDAHRNPLRQAYPTERRVDVGQQVAAAGAVAVFDAGDDAFDMPAQPGAVTDHANIHRLPDVDAVEFGFFKIAVDVKGVAVDHRQHRAPGGDEFLRTRRAVVDVTVDRAADHRAIEVELRTVDRHQRLGQCRLCT